MKIGVYGDSFAHALERKENAWYNFLDHSVTNFAHMGSNLWYSYSLFKKNSKNFDLNIFFVTNWGRLNIPQLEQPHWPGVAQMDMAVKNNTIDQHSKNVLISAINYIVLARNEEQEIDYHKALLQDLATYKNCLMIPCFPYEMSYLDNWNGCSMYDISIKDTIYYEIDSDWKAGERNELRACHMNNQNNKIFANKINNWINGNTFEMNIEEFVDPVEELDYYFKRK